jgi:serine/threonine protein phosphatase PrpC
LKANIDQSQNNSKHFFSVCDGHGSHGHHVSRYIKNHLSDIIKEQLLEMNPSIEAEYRTLFEKAFVLCDQQVNLDLDTRYSGSTVCSTLIDGNMLYCANLGDSRAVMFSKYES